MGEERAPHADTAGVRADLPSTWSITEHPLGCVDVERLVGGGFRSSTVVLRIDGTVVLITEAGQA